MGTLRNIRWLRFSLAATWAWVFLAGLALGGSPDGEGRDIFEELGLTPEALQGEASSLVEQARDLYKNGDLLRAESRLTRALLLDPEHEEADLLLSQVRLGLGDRRGQVAETARWLSEQQKVAADQARTEIRRLISNGKQLMSEDIGEYGQAADYFERAIEGVHNFHFNLNLERELLEAKRGRDLAVERREENEETERAEFRRMLQDQAFHERGRSMEYLENQLRELRRKSRVAEQRQDFDRAILLYQRILKLSPRDGEATRALDRVKEQRNVHKMNEYLRKSAENYELAVLSIQESSVTYQEIFRYPDIREWERITPKDIRLEDEIAAAESTADKEVKRKLEQVVNNIGFSGEPLRAALQTLGGFSNINFLLNKDGQEAADSEVNLEPFPDSTLKWVLEQLLRSVGSDQNLGYVVQDGAVMIGPKSSLKVTGYLKFYEISDIIQAHPDFKAPPIALDEFQGKQGGGAGLDIDLGDDEDLGAGPLPVDTLLELLNKELAGGEDEEDEDETGLSILGGKLAARTTLEKHFALSRLLDQFRKATGMMVTVESRFLDIQDNFLEEIGVSLGSPTSTFLPNNIPDIDGQGTSVAPGWEWVNPSGDVDVRAAELGVLSAPLGSKVNPFNMSSSGGGAYQLNVLKAESYQLEAILTAVAKTQEIRRLSSPRVTAFNGQVSHTLVVNQAAYIQDLEVNQTGVIPVINPVIDVLNSGSILEVRPTVSHDHKYVVLEIQPTLAEQLASEIATLNLSGNFTVVPIELPVLAVTKIKTTITVPDGGTVLVGGLKREISNKQIIGLPGLINIPILNLLFGRKGQSTLRSNLFVLINAKITIVHEEEARLFGT